MSTMNASAIDSHIAGALAYARGGSQTITGTSAQTGDWVAIVGVTPFSFTTLTGTHSGSSGVTYPAGHVIYGRFSAITLATGTVDAYRA
jgi:hypothetical protein